MYRLPLPVLIQLCMWSFQVSSKVRQPGDVMTVCVSGSTLRTRLQVGRAADRTPTCPTPCPGRPVSESPRPGASAWRGSSSTLSKNCVTADDTVVRRSRVKRRRLNEQNVGTFSRNTNKSEHHGPPCVNIYLSLFIYLFIMYSKITSNAWNEVQTQKE